MHRTIKTSTILLSSLSLCACIYNEGTFKYQSYDERASYNPAATQQQQNYQPYNNYNDYNYKAMEEQREEKRQVVVPETYHMQSYQSPPAHKSRDKRWVETQNPQGYTIEVADSSKPSEVAAKLHKAPKTQRSAQVQYSQNGSAAYKGLYGSYSSYEEAERAYNNLPDDVKSSARIRPWSTVQQSVGE